MAQPCPYYTTSTSLVLAGMISEKSAAVCDVGPPLYVYDEPVGSRNDGDDVLLTGYPHSGSSG